MFLLLAATPLGPDQAYCRDAPMWLPAYKVAGLASSQNPT